MTALVSHCLHCDVELQTRKTLTNNKLYHRGRGLCSACYQIMVSSRQLDKYPLIYPAIYENRFEDYCELVKQGYTREQIAERLGVKLVTLDRTLYRLKHRGIDIPLVPKR